MPSLSDAVDRPLTEGDVAAGVISDRVGYFDSATARREGIAKIRLREVIITYEENGEQISPDKNVLFPCPSATST